MDSVYNSSAAHKLKISPSDSTLIPNIHRTGLLEYHLIFISNLQCTLRTYSWTLVRNSIFKLLTPTSYNAISPLSKLDSCWYSSSHH